MDAMGDYGLFQVMTGADAKRYGRSIAHKCWIRWCSMHNRWHWDCYDYDCSTNNVEFSTSTWEDALFFVIQHQNKHEIMVGTRSL
jgi:hypothetical protein